MVAAGPGDPQLMTLRGAEALAGAAVVVSDSDVLGVAEHLAPDAEVVAAVDANGLPITRAARVKKVLTAARAGSSVVRLMSGDPSLDGALAEEGEALHKAGIRFDYVPGASTLAISAFAGVPLTTKRVTKVLALTGVDDPLPTGIDNRTTVVALSGADRADESSWSTKTPRHLRLPAHRRHLSRSR